MIQQDFDVNLSAFVTLNLCHTQLQEYVAKWQVPSGTLVTKVIEGFETVAFRSNFLGWSLSADPAVSEEGKCKVAGRHSTPINLR